MSKYNFVGSHMSQLIFDCRVTACVPTATPLIPEMIKVSSEDSFYTRDQLPKCMYRASLFCYRSTRNEPAYIEDLT